MPSFRRERVMRVGRHGWVTIMDTNGFVRMGIILAFGLGLAAIYLVLVVLVARAEERAETAEKQLERCKTEQAIVLSVLKSVNEVKKREQEMSRDCYPDCLPLEVTQ